MYELEEILYELCETVEGELEKANMKIKKSGGEITSGDVDYLDKLTHTLKSIKTTMAMLEGGYSSEGGSSGASYEGGGSYARRGGRRSYEGGGSSARSRGSYARRYSSERGYSRAEDNMDEIVDELRSMMGSLPQEKQMKVQKFIREVEQM